MSLCKNGCGREAVGRSMYCSPSCKVAYNRNKTNPIETNRNIGKDGLRGVGVSEATIESLDAYPSAFEAKPDKTLTIALCRSEDLGGFLGLSHYKENPDKYAPRDKPEKLNWGPWMDLADLTGSPFVANRVPIPGDFDYAGVFHEA